MCRALAALAAVAVAGAATLLLTRPLVAQESGGAEAHAVESTGRTSDGADSLITVEEVRRHVGVLAHDSVVHDSVGGRATPSSGLEKAARYVAARFQALGLEPAGDSDGWVQRYPLPGTATLHTQQSMLALSPKPKHRNKPVVDEEGHEPTVRMVSLHSGALVLASDTVLDYRAPGASGGGQGHGSDGLYGPAPVVVAGPQTLASLRQANVQDKIVFYMPAAGTDSATQRELIALLRAANHVAVVADEDSVAFARRRSAARPPVVLDWYLPGAQRIHRWVVYVWAPAIEGALSLAGFSLAEARTAAAPVVRELDAAAMLWLVTTDSPAGPTAPNAAGLLRGRDAEQLVVLTAHLDRAPSHHGAGPQDADDNVAGVAGLLALAKAFKQAGVAPRRSIVFAAVSGSAARSGSAPEFWGSHQLIPRLPGFGKAVLNINLDMLARLPGDSLYLAGLADMALPVRPDWVAAQLPPEVRVTVVDTGSAMMPTSDHHAFVQAVIPSLFVHGGMSADPAAPLDAAQAVRALRFVYTLTRELADAKESPRWTSAGRQRRSRAFGSE